jgi:glycosyltransferase involved in cell wall biosynthesis
MTDLTIFVLNHPTPQRSPTLDRMARELSVPFLTLYLHRDDSGRGWGEASLSHPHVFLPAHRRRRAIMLIRRVLHPRTRIVCCFGYSRWENVLVLLCARFAQKKCVTRSDSSFSDMHDRGPIFRAIKKKLVQTIVGRNTRVWTIGSSNASYWSALGFINQQLIPYETPVLPAFTEADTLGLRRTWLDNDERSVVFLYVGRLTSSKGVGDLLSAFTRLDRTRPTEAHLVLVGGGPLRDAVMVRSRSNPRIHVVGEVSHDSLGSYYRSADFVVIPSRREPWGLVVNEAVGHGRPVVASNRVTSADELTGPTTAIRFAAGSIDDLERALRDATRDGLDCPTPRVPTDTAALMAADLKILSSGLRPGHRISDGPGDGPSPDWWTWRWCRPVFRSSPPPGHRWR